MTGPYFSVDRNGNFEFKSIPAFFMVEDDYCEFEAGDVLPCFVLNYHSQPGVLDGDEAMLYIPACSKNGKSCEAGFLMASIGDKVDAQHSGHYTYYFVDSQKSWCNVPRTFK